MSIHINDSLTRKLQEFKPLNPPRVNMYVCGPTVYDEPHIGHARSAYIFDVIRRYLKYKGYQVKFVRNVTDVDDKIIDKAKKEYPGEDLNISFKKVADKYLAAYHQALAKLGIGGEDIIEPKASEYIDKMIIFINNLIDNGVAYQAGSDVYFDIKKAKNYGKLSGQSLDKMESGARVTPGENKRDPLDFALWKSAKEGEPSWDSPFGKGRPGWHIECSVMSSDILGDEFDIHGGGIDLIFPHHENEIAQSEGAGKKFAKYWIHHGLVTINEQKMSKSLGNFVTIKDILNKGYSTDVLKICFLTVKYSNPLDFSWERMNGARDELDRIKECLNKINFYIKLREQDLMRAGNIKFRPSTDWDNFKIKIDNLKKEFIDAMDDNFNTAKAKAAIMLMVTEANIGVLNLEERKYLEYVRDTITGLCEVLGLSLKAITRQVSITADANIIIGEEEIERKISEREKARKDKNFMLSDKIRKELEDSGIVIEDTKSGTIWRRV